MVIQCVRPFLKSVWSKHCFRRGKNKLLESLECFGTDSQGQSGQTIFEIDLTLWRNVTTGVKTKQGWFQQRRSIVYSLISVWILLDHGLRPSSGVDIDGRLAAVRVSGPGAADSARRGMIRRLGGGSTGLVKRVGQAERQGVDAFSKTRLFPTSRTIFTSLLFNCLVCVRVCVCCLSVCLSVRVHVCVGV